MIYKILLLTLIIMLIYSSLIYILYNDPEEQKKEQKEQKEEREKAYLILQNMTTQEILLFKNKKEFINSIEGYNTIQYFLKGTEEENIEQLIDWYYPGYKKL